MDDSQVRSELPKRMGRLPKSPTEASQPTSEVSDADDGGFTRVLEDAIGEDSNTQRKDLLKLNEVRKCNDLMVGMKLRSWEFFPSV